MSFGGFIRSPDDHACGIINRDPVHQLICKLQQRGVLSVASAGNNGGGIDSITPAGYAEVLAATLVVDFDARPGGLQFTPPPVCFWGELDDLYSGFSSSDQSLFSLHRDHIMAAPGVCINSTFLTAEPYGPGPSPGGPYRVLTGTSQSCPHLSAIAALCLSGYRCQPVPVSPQDLLSKLVSDSRRTSVPLTSIPGPYDIANLFSTGDIAPFAGYIPNAYYGYLPTPLYPFLAEDYVFSPACPHFSPSDHPI